MVTRAWCASTPSLSNRLATPDTCHTQASVHFTTLRHPSQFLMSYNFLRRFSDTTFVLLNYNLYNFCFSHIVQLFCTDTIQRYSVCPFELQPIFCIHFQLSMTSLPSRSWIIWTTGASTFLHSFNAIAPTFASAIFPFPHHILFPLTLPHFPHSLSHLGS